ncbi:MAG: aminotransferase class IV [Planctomycetota bacterium]
MPDVFLNGELMDRGDARLSAFDASVQHAVGLFETMLAVGGAEDDGGPDVVGLDLHLERLIASAAELGLVEQLRPAPLREAVLRTLESSGVADDRSKHARVRLTITGGDLNLLQAGGGGPHQPTVMVQVQPATRYPDELFERGAMASVADLKVNPFNPFEGHKTLNYWPRLRALQLASAKGAAEALVFGVTNHLAGGCVSNALLVKDGRILTPIARGEEETVVEEHEKALGKDSPKTERGAVLPSPVLPGVTRAMVLDAAQDRGIGVVKQMLTVDDVMTADELLLTNSSWGVLPVTRIESHQVGGEEAGEVARLMRSWWVERLAG